MHRRTSPRIISLSRVNRHNPTDAEAKLWKILRSHQFENIHFRRQHAIGPHIVDFCAPRLRLAIEVDGGQHFEQQEPDQERSAFLESKGYLVVRFWNNEVMNDIEGVVRRLLDVLDPLLPPPK